MLGQVIDQVRMRARRPRLHALLEADRLQTGSWTTWLRTAPTFSALVESCERPGWLVYCAAVGGVHPDALVRGAVSIAGLAAARGTKVPLAAREAGRLAKSQATFAELIELIVQLEGAPRARARVDAFGWAASSTLRFHGGPRVLLRKYDADPVVAPQDMGPFRTNALPHPDEVEADIAAGFVLAIETLFVHFERDVPGLVRRAAGAAALLEPTYPDFVPHALRMLRRAFGYGRSR